MTRMTSYRLLDKFPPKELTHPSILCVCGSLASNLENRIFVHESDHELEFLLILASRFL